MSHPQETNSKDACIRTIDHGRRRLWGVVIAAGLVMGLALGVRHVQGLFLLPVTGEQGWSRELFGFALAVQNLTWGIAQPFTGMMADRYGARRVVVFGVVLYALGLAAMTQASSPAMFVAACGVALGVALSCTAFGVIYAAVSRLVAPGQRPWAIAVTGAIGGLGQFVMVPLVQELIASLDWKASLWILAIAMATLAPLALPLKDRTAYAINEHEDGDRGVVHAVREAISHSGFWLLNLGFLACGFQLAFIATHLPAYLIDQGLGPMAGVGALATIALTNIVGIYVCGMLGGKWRQKNLLAILYLARTVAIGLFILLPLSLWTVYGFAAVMGFLWLGTVPLTNGVLTRVFGVRYLATLFGFVFFGHQLGSFLGVWLGGYIFDEMGSYQPIWLVAMALGLIAAALHWPIDDRQRHRPLVAGAAP
ncbi:MAG: MFS transporter [Pseudoxanthomonas sp.]